MKYLQQSKPIRDLIKKYESRDNYVVVWGGIKKKDHPPRDLTTMTVGEVLAWQDSIDRRYMSEAAGAYQILEDTLRGLCRQVGVSHTDLFDEATQDRLGYALLVRRGLEEFMEDRMSRTVFGNNLAKEWASLPVLRDCVGASQSLRRGQSYYAGDKLNAAHAKPEEVEEALDAMRLEQDKEKSAEASPTVLPERVSTGSFVTVIVAMVLIIVFIVLIGG